MNTASSTSPCPSLPLVLHRIRFDLAFEATCRLPGYPGSAIRGLLGHGLRHVLCITHQPACNGCRLLNRCGYARFFETSGVGNAQGRRFAAAPHPWVLDLDVSARQQILERGDVLTFRITLLGDMGQALPWLVLALEHAASLGFGNRHVPFRLAGVALEAPLGSEEWQWISPTALPALAAVPEAIPRIPDRPEHLKLHLTTPLRLKRDGRLVRPDGLNPVLFLGALRLRLRDLLELYGQPDRECRLPDIPETIETALLDRQLQWRDWTRWSSRQKTKMKLGGIIGEMTLDTAPIADWWPLLWLGQWLHVGKQTSMGLGQYRLVTGL